MTRIHHAATRPHRLGRWSTLALAAIVAVATLPAIAAAPALAATALAATAESIGAFEQGLDGWSGSSSPEVPAATGEVVRVDDPARTGTGAAAMRLDVSAVPADGGNGWISAVRALDGADVESVEFWALSSDFAELAVRLVDATGQTHQVVPALTDGGWQQITVIPGEGTRHASWGGAGDGVWHGPAQQLAILATAGGLPIVDGVRQSTGEVVIDDVTLQVADAPVAGIELGQTRLGNIFHDGEHVVLDVSTDAELVSWAIADARGVAVDQGQQAGELGSIELGTLQRGWYRLEVTASTAGQPVGSAATDLAVVPASAGDGENPFGVSAHYGASWSNDSIPLAAELGLSSIRDELYWSHVEQQRGVIDLEPSAAEWVQPLIDSGVEPLIIADYGNQFYDGGNGPVSEAAVQAYGDYAVAIAERFGDDLAGLEIWNEWDLGLGGNTNTSAEAYVNLLAATAPRVAAASPDLPIIGPAVAQPLTTWFEDTLKLGALDYIDGVVMHPYSYPNGAENLDSTLQQVNELIARYNDGQSKPLWITEHGWPTGTNARAVDEAEQAENIAKSAAIALSRGAERYYVYDFVNDGTDPSDSEENFGLLRHPDDERGSLVAKPAAVAYSVAADVLGEVTFTDRDTGLAGVWNLGFADSDGTGIRAVWTESPQVLALAADAPVTVVDLYGAETVLEPGSSGEVLLAVDEEPRYIIGDITALSATENRLTLDAANIGRPLTGTWVADNTAGDVATEFQLRIDGVEFTQSVPAGQTATLALELPAPTAAGTVMVTGELSTTSPEARYLGHLSATTVVRESLSFTGAHAVDADGASLLRLRFVNAGPEVVTLDGVDIDVAGAVSTRAEGSTVEPGDELVLDTPIGGVADGASWAATARIAGGEALAASGVLKTVDEAAAQSVPARTIEVDGAIDADLRESEAIDLLSEGTDLTVGSTGPSDLTGSVWFTWDDENLYLSARIADDVHNQPASNDGIWRGDSIQFTVGAGAPGEQTQWSEIGLALAPTGSQLYRWLASDGEPTGLIEGSEVAVQRDNAAGETVYEASIPWSRLGRFDSDDRLFSTALIVNENDEGARAGYIEWGSGIALSKDSSLFNPMLLNPEPDEPEEPEEPQHPHPPTLPSWVSELLHSLWKRIFG